MTLEDAITLLRILYDYATKQKWITYPLGWAFYKTWIEVDEMRYKKHDKHTD